MIHYFEGVFDATYGCIIYLRGGSGNIIIIKNYKDNKLNRPYCIYRNIGGSRFGINLLWKYWH